MTHHASQHCIFYLLLIRARFTAVWRIVQELIPCYIFPLSINIYKNMVIICKHLYV